MGPVEQPFGSSAGQDPHQLKNFRDSALAIKNDVLGIQSQRQPSSHRLVDKPAQFFGITNRRQAVIVGDEKIGMMRRCQFERRPDGTEVVAHVDLTGGLDAGQHNGFRLCAFHFTTGPLPQAIDETLCGHPLVGPVIHALPWPREDRCVWMSRMGTVQQVRHSSSRNG